MDYYEILQVSNEANQEDIKKAYQQLILKHHPDKQQEQKDGNFEIFLKVDEGKIKFLNIAGFCVISVFFFSLQSSERSNDEKVLRQQAISRIESMSNDHSWYHW